MGRILGIDVGTNSLGWAVIEKNGSEIALIKKGVHIFQEGVKYEKGNEQSRAAERTRYRSARRLIRRRRIRKINTLEILIQNQWCPNLEKETLQNWKNKKQYPLDKAFLEWQRTDENENKNPYHYRHICLHQKLDLNNESERYILGRAFYHLTQRRGFLSNRLENTQESDGEVKKGISSLTDEIEKAGFHYLGEYFYHCYQHGIKIRKRYIARKEHYWTEFQAICEKQELSSEQRNALEYAIFSQRPLKSQKGSIGKCVFEKNKPRCPISHPRFEEYRMLCFINNIRIKTPSDEQMRFLNTEERQNIIPLFLRKSKNTFSFEDIAKKLSSRKPYKYYKEKYYPESDVVFNYRKDTTISGCPTMAALKDIGGDYWEEKFYEQYDAKIKTNGIKNREEVLNDIWHALFTFDNTEKLVNFAIHKLKLTDEEAQKFAGILLKQGYASLSLKAIQHILPGLRQGLLYSHAVFLANLDKVVPAEIWQIAEKQEIIRTHIQALIENHKEKQNIADIVNGLIRICHNNQFSWEDTPLQTESYQKSLQQRLENYYGKNKWQEFPEIQKKQILTATFMLFSQQMHLNLNRGEFLKHQTVDEEICEYLIQQYDIAPEKLKYLYHPSDIEIYKPILLEQNGKNYLGSPRIAAMKNPMAMRSLFRLRKVVNELLKQGIIDRDTRIQIELSRDLNDKNKRLGLQQWQKQRENQRNSYKEEIRKLYKEECHRDIEPTEDEVLKYQLWKEQNGTCLYTGEQISICDFIGAGSIYDIEHTIPRSRSYDNSQKNLTLCNAIFNRDIKRNKIPTELPGHAEILKRIESWKEKYLELEKRISTCHSRSRNASTKEAKDTAIQQCHFLTAERDYWKEKYERFTMKDVPEGFKNSQLVDNSIISKYARLYLKTLFPHTMIVKGSTVATFRKIWGLQDEYEKKERINHIHHCIDAITIACISKKDYEELAHYYYEYEQWEQQRGELRPSFPKPWKTFTEDVKRIEEEVLISHYTPDVLPKQNRKYLRNKGQIKRTVTGSPIIQQGDSIRGSLHQETNYGAIKRQLPNKNGEIEERIHYVVRKPVDSLGSKDIENIVDETVRKKVRKAFKETGSLTNVWMNEEKRIPIKSVRCYVRSVTNPISLKQHRDISKQEYKQFNYVANDSNYLMAIYEGTDAKGKLKRDFELLNNLEASQYYKKSNLNEKQDTIVPLRHINSGYELSKVIKTGTMVILWENSPKEVWDLEINDIKKRLYKVVGLSEQIIQQKYHYGTIVLKHHQEAKSTSELKIKDGSFQMQESYIPYRKMNHNQFNALVEGYDFRMNVLGDIEKII